MALDMQGIAQLLERWGYLIVFVASLAEALPLLGFLVPGQAIIILAGAAAASGLLNIWVIILIAIPAGIVGDALGFYVGRRFGRSFLERYGPRLRIGQEHLARSDALFAKYGPFALVIARFSFLTRAVGPILAGMARMRPAVFWPVNVIGAIAWAAAYSLLGYFFGVSFLYLQSTVGRILAWTLVAVVGFYLFYRFLRKYAHRFTREDFYLALLGVISGAVFGVLADRVQKLGMVNVLDLQMGAFTYHLRGAAPLLRLVEAALAPEVLAAVSLALLAILAARRFVWEAVLIGLGVGGSVVLVQVLRPVFARVLPAGPGDAFPSGHAAAALVFAGVLTYLAASHAKSRPYTIAVAVGGALVTLFAALSRLGQGEEYPSAVLAGLAIGAAWLSLAILLVEFALKRDHAPARP